MRLLNSQNKKGDLVIMVSDNESWSNPYGHNATNLQVEWQKFKTRNPKAKLVCIDITPGSTAQAKSSKDTLNVGGFSDNVFTVISEFIKAGSEDHWTKTIQETVNLG
jgi:60 kDa SS-A/Ro ribonucleoprotein